MRLTDASVAIRPRNAWEAIDLGVRLARRHQGLLMLSWAALTLPLFALISVLLWQYPTLAFLLFWWLKPAWERLPLHILSRAMFGEVPSLRQALRDFPSLLRPQLLASLTWRRLSPTRSFDLPVLQLEGLSGAERSKRLALLSPRHARAATWLTLLGAHLELLLWGGLVTLLWLLVPQQVEIDWDWSALIEAASGDWLWLEHLSNLLYALILVFWEPIYVACGFTLYLNRRTELEAWDIELAFRRLRQRLTGSAYALLLCASLVLLPHTPALADPPQPDAEQALLADGPEAARLLNQPLTSQQAHDGINALLEAPPFVNRETVTRWRLGEEKPDADETADAGFLKTLGRLFDFLALPDRLDLLSLIFEVLLWSALLLALAVLVWRYREWLATFASNIGFNLPRRQLRQQPGQLFGLEVTPESLPDDIAGTAEQLWATQPREALGLLYRGLLSRLLHDYQLPLKSAHTEGEVLKLVGTLQQSELARYSQSLTRHWQNLAYGHRLPPAATQAQLCQHWRTLFATGAQP